MSNRIKEGLYLVHSTSENMAEKVLLELFPDSSISFGFETNSRTLLERRKWSPLHFTICTDAIPYKATGYDGVLHLSEHTKDLWLLTYKQQGWLFRYLGLAFEQPSDFVIRQLPINFDDEVEVEKLKVIKLNKTISALVGGKK